MVILCFFVWVWLKTGKNNLIGVSIIFSRVEDKFFKSRINKIGSEFNWSIELSFEVFFNEKAFFKNFIGNFDGLGGEIIKKPWQRCQRQFWSSWGHKEKLQCQGWSVKGSWSSKASWYRWWSRFPWSLRIRSRQWWCSSCSFHCSSWRSRRWWWHYWQLPGRFHWLRIFLQVWASQQLWSICQQKCYHWWYQSRNLSPVHWCTFLWGHCLLTFDQNIFLK